MIRQSTSEKAVLFTYFITLICTGGILLSLPAAWNGEGRLPLIDSIFTSVSAVCVTGLITVDTARYTPFGQTVILCLIQFGGLGILTFTTMFFISPREKKVSLRNIRMVKNYYLESIDFQAHHILRNILLLTFGIEAIGALLLWLGFRSSGAGGNLFFLSLFHSVSAFCNAGFSLFSDSLVGYRANPYILTVILLLLVLGGVGFLVMNDLYQVARHKKKRLSLHTMMVLGTTGILIIAGTLVIYLLEVNNSLSGMSFGNRLMNALFQALTPRTAGFNTLSQNEMTVPAQFFTMILMFIGGSPASIAGGVKTTTVAIVFLAIFKEIDWQGRLKIHDRALSQKTVTKSMLFLGKAVAILVLSIFLLALTELGAHTEGTGSFLDIAFESFSAFATVGLSTGLTGDLTAAGKLVIIVTMFVGRVGLISLSIPLFKEGNNLIDYPEEEVLIG